MPTDSVPPGGVPLLADPAMRAEAQAGQQIIFNDWRIRSAAVIMAPLLVEEQRMAYGRAVAEEKQRRADAGEYDEAPIVVEGIHINMQSVADMALAATDCLLERAGLLKRPPKQESAGAAG